MKRNMIWALGLVLMAMVACAGGQGGRQDAATTDQLLQYKRTLQFLTDLDINPDTLMLPECVNFPVFSDTTSHSHWLTADEAVTLGMKQLCGVDADGTPAILLGVRPLSEHITLALYQVYYGDKSPVVIATYDADGVVMDLMNAGTCAGVNTLYANQDGDAMQLGVDSAVIALKDDGELAIDHTLTMVQQPATGGEAKQLWKHLAKLIYQVDTTTGVIKQTDSQVTPPEVINDNVVIRQLEMISWAPIQDEEVMAQYDQLAQQHAAALSGQSLLSTLYAFALFDRLDHAPWSMLEWLYLHPDSRVHKLFIAAVWEHQLDNDRLAQAVKTIQEPKAKQYWKTQLGLK